MRVWNVSLIAFKAPHFLTPTDRLCAVQPSICSHFGESYPPRRTFAYLCARFMSVRTLCPSCLYGKFLCALRILAPAHSRPK